MTPLPGPYYVDIVVQFLSHVWLLVIPWTVACRAPLSVGFPRQEYWSGLPCLPPGDLPDPGVKPLSLLSPVLAGGFYTTGKNGNGIAFVQ